MGYFANSTEGADFESIYCSRCIHGVSDDEDCPVMEIHALFMADLDGTGSYGEMILKELIPVNVSSGKNEKCRMFLDRARKTNEN